MPPSLITVHMLEGEEGVPYLQKGMRHIGYGVSIFDLHRKTKYFDYYVIYIRDNKYGTHTADLLTLCVLIAN